MAGSGRQGVEEVLAGLQRIQKGILQEEFRKLASREKKYKLERKFNDVFGCFTTILSSRDKPPGCTDPGPLCTYFVRRLSKML